MDLKSARELQSFLSTYFPDGDPDADEEATRAFLAAAPEKAPAVLAQARLLAAAEEFPLEPLGLEANRWFADADEGRAWVEKIVAVLAVHGGGAAGSDDDAPKDSNGAVLAEGDSVIVIKDLKVKGGSNDLKRGALLRKIHLIGDPGNIECRVDGSTLVLKTMFLKKA
jgi:protein PhnA